MQASDQPEIQNFDHVIGSAPGRENDVGRFYIAMDEPNFVGLGQRTADLAQDINYSSLGLRTKTADELIKVNPTEVFHRVIE